MVLYFPHDEIYGREKIKQIEIHRKKMMKKCHADTKYHAVDQNLYEELNYKLND